MKRILAIDLGNTAAKATLFVDGKPEVHRVVAGDDPDGLLDFCRQSDAGCVVYCSVRGDKPGFGDHMHTILGIPVTEITAEGPFPFDIDYGTPGTLGIDRIAGAAGAIRRYGGNVLLVDAGTAVTADVVEGNVFRGGNISPGLKLRFRSLNDYTGRLPLVSPHGELPPFGHDTEGAIRTGVVRGLVAEIVADYRRAAHIYNDIQLVLTGGDATFLAPLIREEGLQLRVDHDLVGLGLTYILENR